MLFLLSSRQSIVGGVPLFLHFLLERYIIEQEQQGAERAKYEIIQSGIGQLDTAYKKVLFKVNWTHYQIFMCIEDKDERSL